MKTVIGTGGLWRQDYTMAYLRYLAGLRDSEPRAAGYTRALPDGTTLPLTEKQALSLRLAADDLVLRIQCRSD